MNYLSSMRPSLLAAIERANAGHLKTGDKKSVPYLSLGTLARGRLRKGGVASSKQRKRKSA